MTDITALRDFALDHPDKPYLREAADEISRLRRLRQDNEAVIAQLQNDLREARVELERLREEVALWEERTKMGASIIEENVALIEQLRSALQHALDWREGSD